MDAPKSLCQLHSLGLPAIKDRLDEVRRQAGERKDPADVGVRYALLGGEVSDRHCIAVLDPPTPGLQVTRAQPALY